MTAESRNRKSTSVSFSVPNDHFNPRRTFSLAESEWDYDPTISTINPTALAMIRSLRHVKSYKRSWDSDKALKSTYKGLFGKHQLRVYILLAVGYAVVAAWLAEMPAFALLVPKYVDCTPYYANTTNLSNQSSADLNRTAPRISDGSIRKIDINGETRIIQPIYNYSKEYGRTVVTDFNIFCEKTRLKIPYITLIIGLILGGLIFGYIADRSGRKMVLLGSMWTACALSIFQLLSDDYISYVFFAFFMGITIGAVQVIAVPYVMEMFPIQSRAIYGLALFGAVFLLDLVIPWLGLAIKNWKILQAVVSIPLIITVGLYWFAEESMFWYTTQKDYVSAVLSLTKIAKFNGVDFQEVFQESSNFLHGKHSKAVQCDFQPLLRLEDIKSLGSKYPDFDMTELQMTTSKKNTLSQRILRVITGHHYQPTLSTFYPTDFFHSAILSIYLLVMCGLWLVSSLTEYSLDASHLTQHLPDNFYHKYFYTNLIQIVSFIIAVPLVYKWGRRWPTFCFFLIAEVCLLGSVAVKLDDEQTRTAMLVVYCVGKFATRAAFIVIVIYTCEIFPTGLRCTTLGICYTFRLIGCALASPNVGELNDWMSRLIYGILSLIIGAMALLLPETKKFPLPRTIIQVEMIPTSISNSVRRQRSVLVKRNVRPDGSHPDSFNDANSVVSGRRSIRPYDNQSTLHSIYELQDFASDDTIHSLSNRHPPRRLDLRNSSFYQPYSVVSNDMLRRQQSIAEAAEYDDDVDDDQTRVTLQRRLNEQRRQLAAAQNPMIHTNEDFTKKPPTDIQSSFDHASQLDKTAQIQSGDITGDRSGLTTTDEIKENTNREEKFSQSPRFQRALSQDENYFSEHC